MMSLEPTEVNRLVDHDHECPFYSTGLGSNEINLEDGRLNPTLTHLDLDFDTFAEGRPTSNAIKDSFPNLPGLTSAGAAGCGFCSFLVDIFRSTDVAYLFKDMQADVEGPTKIPLEIYFEYRQNQEHDLKLNLLYIGIWTLGRWITVRCSVDEIPKDGSANNSLAWLPLEDASADQQRQKSKSLTWIQDYLSECAGSQGLHEGTCTKHENSSFLPTRLIEICNDTSTLRIVNSSDIKAKLPYGSTFPNYTALSYCWGIGTDASSTIKTTAETLGARMAGFDFAEVPKALQDAIAVTKAISVSYIWIDTLCILQGSKDDWEAESEQMAEIYGHAYVTICSTSASCHTGFLDSNLPRHNVEVRASGESQVSGTLSLTFLDVDCALSGRNFVKDGIPKSRWLSRGWTHQERLSSKRMLIFHPARLAFSCHYMMKIFGQEDIHMPIETIGLWWDGPETIYKQWLWVTAKYTQCALTFQQDTLPAISGVAKVFAKELSDEYAAGIWKSDLVRGLLWEYRRHNLAPWDSCNELLVWLGSTKAPLPSSWYNQIRTKAEPPKTYLSPSWSWAGHHGVDFVANGYLWTLHPECSVEASTTIDGKNAFGRVKGGQLIITGHTYEIEHFMPENTCDGEGDNPYFRALSDGISIHCIFDWKQRSGHESVREKFKLVLLATSEEGRPPNVVTKCFGLVIHRSAKKGCFYRVGMFTIKSTGPRTNHPFKKAGRETCKVI